MMKRLISLLTLIFGIIVFTNPTIAIEKGTWTFVEDENYCYIGSKAEKTDLPENKKRGNYYILVYKYRGNPETIIQIEAGYDYKLDQQILVKIDKGEYIFYTTADLPDSAWTNDDEKVIFAMKKGLELVVSGESSRGTVTNDNYTLKGFTSAYNKLLNNC